MTNREKLNKLSNDDLVKAILGRIITCPTSIQDDITAVIDDLVMWLDMEVEDEIVNIPNIGKMPKTDKAKMPPSMDDIRSLIKTDANIGFIMREIQKLSDRLDKLEESEYHNAMAIERLEKAEELEKETTENEKTADEMFEELEYRLTIGINKTIIKYELQTFDGSFIIEIDKVTLNYCKYCLKDYVARKITEAEDKAICKKIEELKNGK